MPDNSELLHLPNQGGTSIVIPEVRSKLIARARKDAAGLMARQSEPLYLAAVKLDGKWGLIDKGGRFIAEPVYHEILPFSCGRAAFSTSFVGTVLYQLSDEAYRGRSGKADLFETILGGYHRSAGMWGYFDCSGRVAINPRFEHVRGFSEELAGVRLDGKWGFINKDGAFVVAPRFGGVRDFKDGRAIVLLNNRCGVIDRSGEFIIEPRFDYLWEFSDDLACAEIDGKYGYVDFNGAFAIKPQFDSAYDFRGGVASVTIDERLSLIDQRGNIIFQCEEVVQSLGDFIDGVARVSARHTVYASECPHDVECRGACDNDPCSCEESELECDECSFDYAYYVDMEGRAVLGDHRLEAICDFGDGMGLVGLPTWDWDSGRNNYLYGYVDLKGQVTIPPKFHGASPFKNGRAAVSVDGEVWRLINKDGLPVGERHFDGIEEFQEGLARIETDQSRGFNGKYGFIDVDGNVVIEPLFAWLEGFKSMALLDAVTEMARAMTRTHGGDLSTEAEELWFLANSRWQMTFSRLQNELMPL